MGTASTGGYEVVALFMGNESFEDRGYMQIQSPVAEASGFGGAIGSGLDVDGDGYEDLVFGLQTDSSEQLYGGAIFLYSGGDQVDASTVRVVVEGLEESDYFGNAIAGLDADGDGFDDVAVAAYGDGPAAGAVYLLPGSAEGLDELASVRLLSSRRDIGQSFGRSLAGAGDMNGDGYPELLVGAYKDDSYGTDAGAAFLFAGGPDGLVSESDSMLVPSDAAGGAYFGNAVALGDLTGDGIAEAIVGSHYAHAREGRVYVYQGCEDTDSDGVCVAVDCDDGDPAVGAPDGVWYLDADGDGYGHSDPFESCPGVPGVAEQGGDCNDTDGEIHPGAEEAPGDLVDQDCDGLELCYVDVDGDGTGGDQVEWTDVVDCSDHGHAAAGMDCDDTDATTHPDAWDACGDGHDADCDGTDPACLDESQAPLSEGCGCRSSPPGALALSLGLMLALRRQGYKPYP